MMHFSITILIKKRTAQYKNRKLNSSQYLLFLLCYLFTFIVMRKSAKGTQFPYNRQPFKSKQQKNTEK